MQAVAITYRETAVSFDRRLVGEWVQRPITAIMGMIPTNFSVDFDSLIQVLSLSSWSSLDPVRTSTTAIKQVHTIKPVR